METSKLCVIYYILRNFYTKYLDQTNILVTEDNICCISDFGLPIKKSSICWLPPELVVKLGDFTQYGTLAGDIYALAATIIEVCSTIESLICKLMFSTNKLIQIITKHPPFYNFEDSKVQELKTKGTYPDRPDSSTAQNQTHVISDDFWTLIEWCFECNPDERPPITEVSAEISVFSRLSERKKQRRLALKD